MNTILKIAAAFVSLTLASTGALAQTGANNDALSARTKANLMTAMEGEAMANVKYLRYADQAEAEGNKEVANLFRNNANVEAAEHFDREANLLGFGTDVMSNLEEAMSGEYYEHTKMYVKFAEEAEADGDMKAAALFRQTAEDEGVHYNSYLSALAKIK
jgi:rubrerythrin